MEEEEETLLVKVKTMLENQKSINEKLKTYGPLKAKLAELDEKLEHVKGKLETVAGRDELQENMARAQEQIRGRDPMPGGGDELTEIEMKHKRRYDVVRAVIAAAQGEKGLKDAGLDGTVELETSEMMRDKLSSNIKRDLFSNTENDSVYIPLEARSQMRRTLTTQDDALGGILVPPERMPGDIVDILRNRSVVRQAGARSLNFTGSPVTLPVMTKGVQHFWVGECKDIPETMPEFGELQMTPKKLAALIPFCNEWLFMSQAQSERMILDDLGNAFGEGEDQAFLNGSGSDKKPLGIANWPGIAAPVAPIAGPPTFDHLIEMIYAMLIRNTFFGNLAWIYAPRTWKDLVLLKDSDNRSIWTPDPSTTPFNGRLHGIPTWVSNNVPIDLGVGGDRTQVFLANMDDIIVGNWGGMALAKSEHWKFGQDLTVVRATKLVDIMVRRPGSIVLDDTFEPTP